MLVSVVVICYNSGAFVLEALESIYHQTFGPIELIVSDDCSTDDTVEICKKWLITHKSRFITTRIVSTNKNGGVAINVDNGTRAANGEWIKLVAGDDILPSDAIEQCVKYVTENSISTLMCTRSYGFYKDHGQYRISSINPTSFAEHVLKGCAAKQYRAMLRYYVMPTSMFIAKSFLEKLNYYDTEFPYIDDFPLFLKIASNGYSIVINDEIVAYYHRTKIDSISQSQSGLLNVRAFRVGGLMDQQNAKYVLPHISPFDIPFWVHHYIDRFRRLVIIDLLKNRNTLFCRMVNKFILLFDPIFMHQIIYNKLNKRESDVVGKLMD